MFEAEGSREARVEAASVVHARDGGGGGVGGDARRRQPGDLFWREVQNLLTQRQGSH